MLDIIIASVTSALGGGGVIKGIEVWLKRNRDKIDDRKQITNEWREDYDKLEKRLDLVEKKLELKTVENEELKIKIAEKEFQLRERELAFREYKTHVYELLIRRGASPELIEEIRNL